MNILNKLTIKHLKMNKKRTTVTIIGVILSTALMVGIGLIFSSFREYMIESTIKSVGDYHVLIENVPKDKLSLITKNIKIKDYYYAQHLGYAYLENSINEYKPYLNVLAVSDSYFDELNLIEGRLPKNDNEVLISAHIQYNGGVDYDVGDTLNLEIGERYFESKKVETMGFMPGEVLNINDKKTYTIVGIVERSVLENYSEPGYSIFTKESNNDNNLNVYIHYKKVKDTYKISEDIADKLGFKSLTADYKYYEEINYNSSLLAMYGISRYENVLEGVSGILNLILCLISVGCIIVIYNSFAISVMERKKQFGLFSSIGATKHQLRKTVFFEAFIIGIIGIPLGLLGGFLGISVVIEVVNYLAPDDLHFYLSVYPLFIVIPIIFMIIVIIVSAFIPAKRASKITPIEAIRLNDDIKIKRNKLKTNKFVKKIFGIEGDIALKNIKRNKRKYRITIISLFISIVMFITFSSFIDYLFKGVDDVTQLPDYDINVMFVDNVNEEIISKIVNHEQVDKSVVVFSTTGLNTNTDFSSITTDDYKKIHGNYFEEVGKYDNGDYNYIWIEAISNEAFANYLNELGYKEAKPVLLNVEQGINYTENSRKSYNIKKYKSNNLEIDLYDGVYDEKSNVSYEYVGVLNDYYLGNKAPFGMNDYLDVVDPVFIISKDMLDNNIFGNHLYTSNVYIRIVAKKYDELEKLLDNYKFGGHSTDIRKDTIQYVNYTEEFKNEKNSVLAVKILIYGFIALVTLIGVTSVFNTINTSIALRRKEFAMLRSVGLTSSGFNKMLYLESIIIGLKSLLYSLPTSIILILFVHISMSNITNYDSIILPIKSIIIAIIGVFIIVLITMMYASNKIKHENILEAIREENI